MREFELLPSFGLGDGLLEVDSDLFRECLVPRPIFYY